MAAFALVFAGCGAIVADARYDGRARRRSASALVVRPGDHGDGLRDRPPLGRAHQPGRHGRVHAHAALPAPARRSPTSRAQLRRRGRWRAAAARASGPSKPAHLGRDGAERRRRHARSSTRLVLTAFLMFVIVAVATDTRAVGAAAAIAIGGTVGLDALFGGPVTGASMNPARSFGPALAAGEWTRLLDLRGRARSPGAALGALAYQLVRGERPARRPDGARPVRLPAQRRPLADEPGAVRARGRRAHTRRARPARRPASGCTRRSSRRCASSASTVAAGARRPLTDDLARWADVVVTMGCGDECPYIPGKRYLDWDLPTQGTPGEVRGSATTPRVRVVRAQCLTAASASAAVRRPVARPHFGHCAECCPASRSRATAGRDDPLTVTQARPDGLRLEVLLEPRAAVLAADARGLEAAERRRRDRSGPRRSRTRCRPRSSAARRCAVPTSRVQTPAASPYSVSFARSRDLLDRVVGQRDQHRARRSPRGRSRCRRRSVVNSVGSTK